MLKKRFTSIKEKEELFHTELIKLGVNYETAAQAANILAAGKPDELLAEQEIQLAKEVCREWLIQHKRLASLLREQY